jgi:hypothetical protein
MRPVKLQMDMMYGKTQRILAKKERVRTYQKAEQRGRRGWRAGWCKTIFLPAMVEKLRTGG